jgi:hypothetical protein
MQLSEFAFRIILIFVPGLISLIIIDNLTFHREFKLYYIIIYSLILGVINYYLYYIIVIILKYIIKIDPSISFLDIVVNQRAILNLREIGFVSALSIPIGFIFTFFINYKVLFRIAHFLKISNKFGDIDVWSYIMNLEIPEWVVIRDIKNNIMFEGWIQAFSDSTEKDEIFLRDVIVYENSTGDEIYRIPALYLPRNKEELIIEFPELQFTDYIERSYRNGGKNNGT